MSEQLETNADGLVEMTHTDLEDVVITVAPSAVPIHQQSGWTVKEVASDETPQPDPAAVAVDPAPAPAPSGKPSRTGTPAAIPTQEGAQ